MISYTGRYADLYDGLYAAKDYGAEAGFIDERLRALGCNQGALLDVACGTGSHALVFADLGWDVVGIDSSEDMLDVARTKAAEQGVSVHFERQDMRGLELAGRTFDAVVCLFDSIGYARNSNGVRAVLSGAARHLSSDGVLALEFWHAPAMLSSFEPVRVRRVPLGGAELLRVSETRLLPDEQLAEVTYNLYVLGSDGTYESFVETQICRFFHADEMESYLRDAGFEPLEWYGGYGEPVGDESFHLLVIARAL